MADTFTLDDLKKGGDTFTLSDLQRETQKPASVRAGNALRQIPRQIGLTARYALEGPAQGLQVITEPLRLVTDRVAGVNSQPLGNTASQFADWLGLPKPETADERVVGDATRLGFGAATFGGSAKALERGATGTAKAVFGQLAAKPASQITSGVGAGGAGGAVREAGGSQLEQGVAAVIGGVAGGLTPGGAQKIEAAVRRRFDPAQSLQLEARVTSALKEQGVDWKMLPQAIRERLLDEVRKASPTGEGLDAAALRRLADFRATGLTPTRGMLTLNPVQITREQNLAKIGANTQDEGLQGLALTQNRNNSQLIGNLNRLGASEGDTFAAGASSINRIGMLDDGMKNRVNQLYEQARNMPGGNVPLNRANLVNNIYSRLGTENKLAFLPEEVSKMLDTISAGVVKRGDQTFEVPFDAKALDNLMTVIATAQRGAKDGNVKAALNIVRQAIDDTPIQPIKTQYGGNQLVTEAGANFLRTQDAQAGQFMDALNQARAAARQRFAWQESSRPVEAALSGAEPDKFVQQFVLGGTLDDAAALARVGDRDAIRNAILAHLKGKATSDAADEVAKFSQSGFNRALNQIGERKLSLFFTPEEIAQLQANGRVASYMQVQPVGSAVNNSNSGALMLGRGYDWINAVASKVPFGKQAISDPLRSLDITLSQLQAQNITPALRAPRVGPVAPLVPLASGLAIGGLLAAPGLNNP